MKIVLIRHGESVANKNDIIQGHQDFPLTDFGKKQAEEAADYLLSNNFSIEKIYSSDLSRAKETAEIISKRLEVNSIIFDSRLREFNLGIFQGRKNYEMTDEEKKLLQSCWKDHSKRVPEGENVNEMKTRVKSIFDEIISTNHENTTVLVVGHGGSLYHILHSTLGVFPETTEWFENCKINEIIRDNNTKEWKFITFNNKALK